MNSFENLLFLFLFFVTSITDVSSIYTHAAFVNDMRRLQRKQTNMENISTYDISEEYSLQMNNTASLGLQPCSQGQCKRIAIVGAGVTGLTIAYELSRAGHNVVVYEASDRAGGRIFTYDTGNTIMELGAMRIPLEIHTLVNAYIRKRFDLPLEPFVSYDPNTFFYINGIKRRRDNTSSLPKEYDFQVNLNEQNKSASTQMNEAIQPLFDLFFAEGWNAIMDKYGSYTVKQQLLKFGLSKAMIDYIGVMLGLETSSYLSLTSYFRSTLSFRGFKQFYHIIGGNKRLIDELAKSCQINYSTSVVSIHRNEEQTVDVTTKDAMNTTKETNFDHVVVATTAPAARFIRYTPVDTQVKRMSRALRQLHYTCASKIVLYFNYSWWHDENIVGGSTTTDLPLRTIYYDNYNTTIDGHNHTEAVLLASYTHVQDSILWSSSTLEQITNEVLNNLEEIHSRSDIRNYYLRTVAKHWCNDPFSHGAMASFLPDQEEEIKSILMESFEKKLFFAGEHLSTAQTWIEGAVLSALRVLMQLPDEQFDVVIIGGGILALQTAIELVNRQPTWNILLLEQNTFLNTTCINQFEPSSSNTVIKQYLEFGPNLVNGSLNWIDLMTLYHFNNLPNNYQGQINGNVEFVNTTMIILNLLTILQQDKYSNVFLRENERFINHIVNQLVTDRRTIVVHQKVLFLDNCYLNDHIQQSLQPYRLNVKMEQFPLLSFPSTGIEALPTWFYDHQLLSFDVNHTQFQRKIILFNPNITFGLAWLREHASSLMNIDQLEYDSNYKQTTLLGQDHIIDYLPDSKNQSIIFIGRTNIDLYPVWVRILTDLALNIQLTIPGNYSLPKPNEPQINSSFRVTLSVHVLFFFFFFFFLLEGLFDLD